MNESTAARENAAAAITMLQNKCVHRNILSHTVDHIFLMIIYSLRGREFRCGVVAPSRRVAFFEHSRDVLCLPVGHVEGIQQPLYARRLWTYKISIPVQDVDHFGYVPLIFISETFFITCSAADCHMDSSLRKQSSYPTKEINITNYIALLSCMFQHLL